MSTSSTTTRTSSSGSTTPGPGALSGKVILALGKLTLRGADYVIIRRRLHVISSNFPHSNETNIKGLEQIYDDILELSRHGLYPDTVRTRAIHLVLVQIASRQTRQLVKSLQKWPSIEMQIFVFTLITALDPLRLSVKASTNDSEDLILTFRNSVASWESHSLAPFIDFLRHVAHSTEEACEAVLEAGVMDLLMMLYVTNFRDPLAETERAGFHRTSTLHAASNTLLLTLISGSERGLEVIRGHPCHILWSTNLQLPPTCSIQDREMQRVRVWHSATREHIMWRIHSIFDMTLDWTRPCTDMFLFDACVDLLELAGSNIMDLDISIRALRSLHRICVRDIQSAQRVVRQFLARSTSTHWITITSRILHHLGHILITNSQEARFFILKWDEEHFQFNAVVTLIRFFIIIARAEETFSDILIASGILGLIRPILEDHRKGPGGVYSTHIACTCCELGYILPDDIETTPHIDRNRFFYRGDDRHSEFPELWSSQWGKYPGDVEGSDHHSFWVS